MQIEWIAVNYTDSLSDIECTDDAMQTCAAVATFTELDENNASMSAHTAVQFTDLGISVWGARSVGNFILS